MPLNSEFLRQATTEKKTAAIRKYETRLAQDLTDIENNLTDLALENANSHGFYFQIKTGFTNDFSDHPAFKAFRDRILQANPGIEDVRIGRHGSMAVHHITFLMKPEANETFLARCNRRLQQLTCG